MAIVRAKTSLEVLKETFKVLYTSFDDQSCHASAQNIARSYLVGDRDMWLMSVDYEVTLTGSVNGVELRLPWHLI